MFGSQEYGHAEYGSLRLEQVDTSVKFEGTFDHTYRANLVWKRLPKATYTTTRSFAAVDSVRNDIIAYPSTSPLNAVLMARRFALRPKYLNTIVKNDGNLAGIDIDNLIKSIIQYPSTPPLQVPLRGLRLAKRQPQFAPVATQYVAALHEFPSSDAIAFPSTPPLNAAIYGIRFSKRPKFLLTVVKNDGQLIEFGDQPIIYPTSTPGQIARFSQRFAQRPKYLNTIVKDTEGWSSVLGDVIQYPSTPPLSFVVRLLRRFKEPPLFRHAPNSDDDSVLFPSIQGFGMTLGQNNDTNTGIGRRSTRNVGRNNDTNTKIGKRKW